MNRYRTILFDLDGTLVDSGEGIMNCAELALRHFDIPLPTPSQMRTFVGPPLRDSFARFGVKSENLDEAMAIFRRRYASTGKFEGFLYPGIASLLKTLHDTGFHLLVATSKPEVMAVEILTHFGVASYFEYIAGATLDNSRTTKEQVIAYLLEKVGGFDHAVMVGDTTFDVLGAAVHHIPTIGVSWGYGLEEDTVQAGAIAMAHDAADLLALLQGEKGQG